MTSTLYQNYYGNFFPEASQRIMDQEREFGLEDIQTYTKFGVQLRKIKLDALQLFANWKQQGKHIAAYGAAAKGNTFLNYCGIKNDMIDFVVDSNPYKRGFYLPGSLIPIVGPEVLWEQKPDYLVILP